MLMSTSTTQQNEVKRPPVVVVMGHVDHGKSTLLDYIRSANTVAGEAGGITQHTAAYEVEHTGEAGTSKITFIDTPGHAAFQSMRARGARVADIAILVVAADDGVKAQTKEALKAIEEAGIPYVVAINKMDKPGADPTKARQSLAEASVFVEGWGGDISVAEISAKTGQGVDELLDLVILTAELEEFTGTMDADAEGVVIEAHMDQKRGATATLLIKRGTLSKGMCVSAGKAVAPLRSMEDFQGKQLDEATLSQPITLIGFSEVPEVGETFKAFAKKKDAQKYAETCKSSPADAENELSQPIIVPLVVKADVGGTLEAVLGEIERLTTQEKGFKILGSSAGIVSESDVKLALGTESPVILGFNVKIDKHATDLAQKNDIPIQTFDIIYKMTEWLEEELVRREPEMTKDSVVSTLSVLKHFSKSGSKQLVGCSVEKGTLRAGSRAKLLRKGEAKSAEGGSPDASEETSREVASGKILSLKRGKESVETVEPGNDCGVVIDLSEEILPGDTLEVLAG